MYVQVVRTQMDQEAEIMKQSMARQEAARAAAAEDTEKEEDSAGPLRTVSSGARGAYLFSAVSLLLKQQKEARSSITSPPDDHSDISCLLCVLLHSMLDMRWHNMLCVVFAFLQKVQG